MKNRKTKKIKLVNIAILFIVGNILLIFWNQRTLMKDLTIKKEENILVNRKLENEIKALENEIENSETLEFVEKIAREELGMVKPKEIIVIDKNKEKEDPFTKSNSKDNWLTRDNI